MRVASIFLILTSCFVVVVGALAYMDNRYRTTEACKALSAAVAEEMPGALDDFGRKYPLAGLIRLGVKLFDENDATDKLARDLTESYIRERISEKKDVTSGVTCFGVLILADLNRSEVRAELVKALEREFVPKPEKDQTRQAEKAGSTIYLANNCGEKIAVSLLYKSAADKWVTRGWWNVDPKGGTDTELSRLGDSVYIYATSKQHTWHGAEEADSVSRYIMNAKHFIPDGETLTDVSRYLASFSKVKFDSPGKSVISFSCN